MTLPNSKENLREQFKAGSISQAWPLLIVFARLILAVFAQALVAGMYAMQGNPTPWQAAAPWRIVYGTLVDLGCLLLLVWLVRREDIRLLDLINLQGQRLGRDLLISLGIIVVSVILFVGIVWHASGNFWAPVLLSDGSLVAAQEGTALPTISPTLYGITLGVLVFGTIILTAVTRGKLGYTTTEETQDVVGLSAKKQAIT